MPEVIELDGQQERAQRNARMEALAKRFASKGTRVGINLADAFTASDGKPALAIKHRHPSGVSQWQTGSSTTLEPNWTTLEPKCVSLSLSAVRR
eukprot:2536598-Prymnesium_polylepis.1